MTDDEKRGMNGPGQRPPPPHELVIRMSPEGRVQIQGPLDQRHVCYAMLGMAYEILQRRGIEQEGQRIKPVGGLVVPTT